VLQKLKKFEYQSAKAYVNYEETEYDSEELSDDRIVSIVKNTSISDSKQTTIESFFK
jgi:hypothetical protein